MPPVVVQGGQDRGFEERHRCLFSVSRERLQWSLEDLLSRMSCHWNLFGWTLALRMAGLLSLRTNLKVQYFVFLQLHNSQISRCLMNYPSFRFQCAPSPTPLLLSLSSLSLCSHPNSTCQPPSNLNPAKNNDRKNLRYRCQARKRRM